MASFSLEIYPAASASYSKIRPIRRTTASAALAFGLFSNLGRILTIRLEAELTDSGGFGYLEAVAKSTRSDKRLACRHDKRAACRYVAAKRRKGYLVKPASTALLVRQSIDADALGWGAIRASPEQLAQWRK